MLKLENKTALIVDDDHRNTFALTAYLETMNVRTLTAENGADAMALLEKNAIVDIILLDMMMPIMDGYETLYALHKNKATKNIPVIAVTAKAMTGDREKCLHAGAVDYVSKPIDLKELVEKMESWIIAKC